VDFGVGFGVGCGFTGFTVVVVVRLGMVVVVLAAAVVVLVDVVLAARGVCVAPAQALSARQAAANQTVCRMVTEGNPRSPPAAPPSAPGSRWTRR
jgi:hypothetical protein